MERLDHVLRQAEKKLHSAASTGGLDQEATDPLHFNPIGQLASPRDAVVNTCQRGHLWVMNELYSKPIRGVTRAAVASTMHLLPPLLEPQRVLARKAREAAASRWRT